MTAAAQARVYLPTPRNLAMLARRLRAGELVAIPTETVYGLAANALDAKACAKIFRAKGRPSSDPLIVHIRVMSDLPRLAKVNAAAEKLAHKFWPGPLTLVLPKSPTVPDIVTAGRDSVAIRMPAHPIARRLLALAKIPLAAPSANPFGYISPTLTAHVHQNLGHKIGYILEGGASRIGLESTIVDLRDPKSPVLLRPGAITKRELERVLGRRLKGVRRAPSGQGAESVEAQLAPGMLARHYSPHTRVVLHPQLAPRRVGSAREAFIFMRKPAARCGANVFWFDSKGDLRGIAQRLFALLRQVDELGFDAIHVELASGRGLAEAINDRLRRAAAR